MTDDISNRILQNLIQSSILLKLIEKNFPHNVKSAMVRKNPLSQIKMPIWICKNQHQLFVVRSSFTYMLVKRLLCVPGQNNVNHLQLAIRIVSRKHKLPKLSLTYVHPLVGEQHSSGVYSIAFHPQLPLIASCAFKKGIPKIWSISPDGSTATHVATLQGLSGAVRSVAFHPSLSCLVTGLLEDDIPKFWRISPDGSTATCVTNLNNDGDVVSSIAFHQFLPFCATNYKNTARLWRISPDGSATCVATLQGHKRFVKSITFHPTLSFLVTGSEDNSAKLWSFSSDGSTVTCVKTLVGEEHSVSFDYVEFHKDLPILATSKDCSINLWLFSPDGSTASCVANLKGHGNWICSIAFHPKLPILAFGDNIGTMEMWHFSRDCSTVTCVATLEGYSNCFLTSLAFHQNLPLLAMASVHDETVKLLRWKLDN
jgi:WD40 repeat protein